MCHHVVAAVQAVRAGQRPPSTGGPVIHERNPWVDQILGGGRAGSSIFGAGAGSSPAAPGGLFGQQPQQPTTQGASLGMFGVTANQGGAAGWGVFGQQPAGSPAPSVPGSGGMGSGTGAGKPAVAMFGVSGTPAPSPGQQHSLFGQQPQVQNPFAAAPSSGGGFGFMAQQPFPPGGGPSGMPPLGLPAPSSSAPVTLLLPAAMQAGSASVPAQQIGPDGMAASGAAAGSHVSPYQAPTFMRGKVRHGTAIVVDSHSPWGLKPAQLLFLQHTLPATT